MILAKKRGEKLSVEHGKHGIDEKTSVSFVSFVFVKTHLASSFHLRCSSYVNTIIMVLSLGVVRIISVDIAMEKRRKS